MQYMTTAEIREKYLAYFQEKGCKLVPSSSLIPDDPSLLLTSAGMVQIRWRRPISAPPACRSACAPTISTSSAPQGAT